MEHKEQFLEKSDREVIAQSLQIPRKASKRENHGGCWLCCWF